MRVCAFALVLACLSTGVGCRVRTKFEQVLQLNEHHPSKALALLLLSCRDPVVGFRFQRAGRCCHLYWPRPRAIAPVSSFSLKSAPSFERFSSQASGTWKGASYTWARNAEMIQGESLELNVTSGCVTVPQPTLAEVTHESVSALKEEFWQGEGEADTERILNCTSDEFTFFDDGSWSLGPTRLDKRRLDSNIDAFGLSCVIAHGDASRRHLLVAVINGKLATAYVSVQGHEMPPVARLLLSGRLQTFVEVKAWPGGADSQTLTGVAPVDRVWSTKVPIAWSTKTGKVEGGASLLPPRDDKIAFLPGGCWVQVVDEEGGSRCVKVGSLSADAGEMKVLSNYYKEQGNGLAHLFSRSLQEVVATDEDI
mmetsp:Transcript_21333/g.40840  ORF Transcript_21333/g.40840 Transcript_21333/m.40840 type:complete len:367 (+) Transcript_21333:77-1177(+)